MLTKMGRRELIRLALALAVAVPGGSLLTAQQYHGLPEVNLQPPVVQDSNKNGADTPENRILLAKRMRALNTLRQNALILDTDKLLMLARELNASSMPNGPKMSAADRMKKLAQIEKLAKRVREKMSYAEWGGPSVSTQFSVMNP